MRFFRTVGHKRGYKSTYNRFSKYLAYDGSDGRLIIYLFHLANGTVRKHYTTKLQSFWQTDILALEVGVQLKTDLDPLNLPLWTTGRD